MLILAAALAMLGAKPPKFDITRFGAVGDGITMCTKPIQAAIDAAEKAGGGTVELPNGKFLTGSLRLKSHVELHLDKNAALLGSSHRDDYEKGQWYSLLLADGATDIKLSGQGTVDGQGAQLAQDVIAMAKAGKFEMPKGAWRPPEQERPQIIEFWNCDGVHVTGVTIRNSACWVQKYLDCTDLTIDHVKVDSKTYWNNDGFDIVDCHKVHLSNCDIDSADDGICLKSEVHGHSCSDVLIEHCKIRSSASAIKFGTGSRGGFEHFKIRDIQVRNTFRSCVAIESVDGGIIKDIEVDGLKGISVGNAFFIRLGHRDQNFAPGVVDGIRLRNFDVQIPAGAPDAGYPFQGPADSEKRNVSPSSVVGLPGHPIKNVLIENMKIRTAGGGSEKVANRTVGQVPERAADYPEFSMFGELPAWAFFVRDASGVKLRNILFTSDKPDFRYGCVAARVDGLDYEGVKFLGSKGGYLEDSCGPVKIDGLTTYD